MKVLDNRNVTIIDIAAGIGMIIIFIWMIKGLV
jgi:hypothetical protein